VPTFYGVLFVVSKNKNEQTTNDNHGYVKQEIGIGWEWSYDGADAQHKKDIENVRADNVADGDIGIFLFCCNS